MNWQNRILLLVLPILCFPIFTQASPQKISSTGASEIIRFSLFNYDNLIADHYEKTHDYIGQLAYLLHKNTNCPIETFNTILNNDALYSESNPVRFMLMINQKTKDLCGHYFLDD